VAAFDGIVIPEAFLAIMDKQSDGMLLHFHDNTGTAFIKI